MEDRPLARGQAVAAVHLQVETLGNNGDPIPRHPQVADELITKLCGGSDHVIAAPRAEPPNRPPNGGEPALAGLEVVDDLDDRAAEREGHRLAVDDKVRPEAIDGPFCAKPSSGCCRPAEGGAA